MAKQEINGYMYCRFKTKTKFISFLKRLYKVDHYYNTLGTQIDTGYENKEGKYKGFDPSSRFMSNKLTYMDMIDLIDKVSCPNIYFSYDLVKYINDIEGNISKNKLAKLNKVKMGEILLNNFEVVIDLSMGNGRDLAFSLNNVGEVSFYSNYCTLG